MLRWNGIPRRRVSAVVAVADPVATDVALAVDTGSSWCSLLYVPVVERKEMNDPMPHAHRIMNLGGFVPSIARSLYRGVAVFPSIQYNPIPFAFRCCKVLYCIVLHWLVLLAPPLVLPIITVLGLPKTSIWITTDHFDFGWAQFSKVLPPVLPCHVIDLVIDYDIRHGEDGRESRIRVRRHVMSCHTVV